MRGLQLLDRRRGSTASDRWPAGTRDEQRREGPRGLVAALAAYLFAQAAVLGALYLTYDRFFWLDDKQAQYVPVFHWLGRQVGDEGRPPLVDPDQGMAGAFAADLQYGVLDPVHWLIQWWVASFDGLNAAAWALSGLATVVLGAGSVVLAHALGARWWWAAAGGVGASTTGFLLWMGASWWPSVWASAFVPWLLWALLGRRWWTTAALAPIAYLLGSAGYPYVFFAVGVVLVGAVAEHVVAVRRGRAGVRLLIGKLVAGFGGLVAALPGLLLATGMAPYTGRAGAPDVAFGNEGAFIPNALDVVLGGPTLLGSTSGYWGLIVPVPLFAAAWFAVPGAALVDWRRAWRSAGVPTLLALVAIGFLMTQLPTYVGGLRYSFRYLAVAQPALAVLLAVALSRAPRVTRRRVLLAGALVAGQVALSVARTPALVAWHLVGGLVVALGLAAVLWGGRRVGSRGVAAGVVVLCVSVAVPWVGLLTSVGADREFNEAVGRPGTGMPATPVFRGDSWPASVADFEANAWEPGLQATIISWGSRGPQRGLEAGVLDGSANLLSGTEGGYGYTSLGQAAWQEVWCNDFVGAVNASCGDALDKLLTVAPGTDTRWVDLLSQDRVLLSETAPAELRAHFTEEWSEVVTRRGHTLFERVEPLPGRVTWQEGTSDLSLGQLADERESYRVSTGSAGGALVLRIPWWPGYEATLDGEPLDVGSVDGVAVRVELPAGVDGGELVVRFDPAAAQLLGPAWGAGLVISVAGVLVAHRARRLRRPVDEGAATIGGAR